MSCIYKITNTVNQKCYVGVTNRTLAVRFQEHAKGRQRLISKAIRKYGRKAFTMEILCESTNYNDLLLLESYYIRQHNAYFETGYGYNMTFGGEGTIGRTISIETRHKISQTKKSHPYSPTKEHRLAVSKATKLRIVSDSTKEKIRIAKLNSGANNPRAKNWVVVSPNSEVFHIKGLATFCREHHIERESLKYTLISQKAIASGISAGWKLRPYECSHTDIEKCDRTIC